MTGKLFLVLSLWLLVGMFVLFFTNFEVGWVFFAYVFVGLFGGALVSYRPWLIAAGFLLTGLIVLGAGLFSAQPALQAAAWPTAPGVITRSWKCTKSVNLSVVYSGPCIEYRYHANGQDYQADSTDTREFARSGWLSIPARFAEGREVLVYYDPANPGVSRLTASIALGDWVTMVIGGGLAALAAFTLGWVLLHPQAEPAISLSAGHARRRAAPRAHAPRAHPAVEVPEPDPGMDLADQLEKLAVLHKEQAITDEEYAQAKKRLLEKDN